MTQTDSNRTLSLAPEAQPREKARHYIPASDADISAMLEAAGEKSLPNLFRHIQKEVLFAKPPSLPEELPYEELEPRMREIAGKNRIKACFIGDGLPVCRAHSIVETISAIRNLTTAYTPYQPERSQGTLVTHWIYQCVLSSLTGFEAINSSLYDRASALFEAVCCSLRLTRKTDTVLLCESIHPADLEVVRTLARHTPIRLATVPLDPATGTTSVEAVRQAAEKIGDRLAAIAFPQINSLGNLEDCDALADLATGLKVKSIASIDPLLLAQGGLKPPSAFGASGVDIFVGEAQHLAIGPNFGGPGLGLFGVRHNDKVKNDVRHTPGRYVGKAKDLQGRDCFSMVLSTREQHIRREKATSNICSNQAFLATLAGAVTLARGEEGLAAACRAGYDRAREAATALTRLPGVSLAFPEAPFCNEFTLGLNRPAEELLRLGRERGAHAGIDVSSRIQGSSGNHLKLSFSDIQTDEDMRLLVDLFTESFGASESEGQTPAPLPEAALRQGPAGLTAFPEKEVVEYYKKLGDLNVSPDFACYPLGSCTMKYNPYINDFAAGLPGFTDLHPQAPEEDAQGSLEIIYEIQEWFKGITGLSAVTTQPVAGAQGELVGLKLFQACHEARGETERDAVLIPRSAHGTNFATAIMAGFTADKGAGDAPAGIVLLDSNEDGEIDMDQFHEIVARYGRRISGVMITNPNTSGIFESRFREIAEAIHQVGGLVYMDGANMNAISGWVNLAAMGVDAVHNNLHKTWTIPHGGGGPGDAIVAVSETLAEFLPGKQVIKEEGKFRAVQPPRSIGSFHRHWGNFAHKVRCYTYLVRLGREGVPRMSAIAVLASRYLYAELGKSYPTLPEKAENSPRMHEFILTLSEETFARIEAAGVQRSAIIPRIGKLFLDFGFHAPTVAFPEVFGLMIEPTESYTKAELDRFAEAVQEIRKLLDEAPEVLLTAPHFTPVDRVDEVAANRRLVLSEPLRELPPIHSNRMDPRTLATMDIPAIRQKIQEAARAAQA